MNQILDHQRKLQHLYGMDPSNLASVGDQYSYIKDTLFYLQEEVSELLEALGNGSRDIHKPWSINQAKILNRTANQSNTVKSEAIDMLCFTLNICLAAGITPDNIDMEYKKVLTKNLDRINSGEY